MLYGKNIDVVTAEQSVEISESPHPADTTTPLLVGCRQETVWGHLEGG